MKLTSVINGSIQLVIIPENDIEKEILKRVNGCTAVLISDNNSILNQPVSGALLIKEEKEKK